MRSGALVIPLVTAALAVVSVASGAYRLARAQSALGEADLELANAERQTSELAQLRQAKERISPQERPKQDVIALVNGVMAEAGIPSERLKNLENESSESFSSSSTASGAPASGRYRRQSISVNLEQLAPEQIGKLLLELRRRQSVWTPARLELSHVRTQPDSGNLYNLRLLISATYLSDELPARSR